MKDKEKVIEEHLDVEESESEEEYAVIEERRNVRVDLQSGSDSEQEEIVTSVTPEDENSEEVMQRDVNVEEREPSDPDDDVAVVVDPDATIPWDDPAALVMEREQDDGDVSLSEGVVAESQEDESVHASDTLSSSELDRGGLQGDTTVPEYGVEESVFDMDDETAESGTETDAQSDGGSGVGSDVSEPGTGDDTEDLVGTDDEDEELEDSPENIRQSSRGRIPRRMFTFDNLGGNPTREELA